MSSPAEVIATPKGGGALQGIGEKFSPDLYTGTGNFTVPITLPPGRNGFSPQLTLVYSTGNGNGPFGLGWNLSVPGVSRKTSKGVPLYDDSKDVLMKDVFILSGSEDLVRIGAFQGVPRYRPRTEGLFARILHHTEPDNNYWEVKTKDGLTSFYGTPGAARTDPAVIADPTYGIQSRIFAWKLTRTTDPFRNLIEYSYQRDANQTEPDASRKNGIRHWDQLYLAQIRYVNFGTNPDFLVSVNFIYEDRPDHFSDYRAGFEIRTVRRCTRIEIATHATANTSVRTYHLDYADQDHDHPGMQPLNGCSVLRQIRVKGHDGELSEWLPPLGFGYTQFQPERRKFMSIGGSLPATSLADGNLELVDLFGCGLPDFLEMNGSVRYWRNKGQGQFALPHQMRDAPAGVELSDAGVQILDADGDGTADLLVTTPVISGYYPLRFGGLWDKHSFQRYRMAPSFDLKDPEVHLVDLDGDGVTDAIRSSTRLECYFNDAEKGWVGSRWVERKALDVFPNVDFADPRVKWADMTGDGLQDIVLVHDGLVEYWPSLGRGDWGKRIEMPGPRFPWGYDPKRILLGDVDGDGAADLVYVEDEEVTLWVNQSGNGWSPPIKVKGTPPVSDLDSIRLVDFLGNGIAGVLWSKNANGLSRTSSFFLDFTGGVKPYLLNEMNNHMGATTRVDYKSSTGFYLQDEQRPETRWVTPLPFPVQVVARVETIDSFSGGKLTTEYSYHHGYWDGFEREFRGFGRVDHRDTEVFSATTNVPQEYFSPPTETRTWFHQGAVGDRFDGWTESDSLPGRNNFTDEYYQERWLSGRPNAQVLSRPAAMANFIGNLALAARRDAFRSMRGKILRTELYALDDSPRQSLPYTVTEHVYGVRDESPPDSNDLNRLHVFFPVVLSQRTTQWERGTDPLTLFEFTDDCALSDPTVTTLQTIDYDPYGQLLSKINIAVPRGRDFRSMDLLSRAPYLATQTIHRYAQRDDQQYIVDRASAVTTFEIPNDGSASIVDLVRQIQSRSAPRNVVSHNLSFYDGAAFQGRSFSTLGDYGALVRTDTLVLTDKAMQNAYGGNQPPYLAATGTPNWTSDYPQEFRQLLPAEAGYTYQTGGTGSPYQTGYYRASDQRRYDFQEASPQSQRGLITARHDPLGHETTIAYDNYQLLPTTVTHLIPGGVGTAPGLVTQAGYDYRVFQPNLLTDANGNQTSYSFSPLGLLQRIVVMGQPGQNLGDNSGAPGTEFTYSLIGIDVEGLPVPLADLGQPVSVRTVRRVHHTSETDVPMPDRDQTISTIEYSDGFGRVLQTRSQGEDVIFDSASQSHPIFGDAGLPANQSEPGGDAVGQQALTANPFVVVSGWQIYDNKGQVVEKYEPFFSTGWDHAEPGHEQLGQKAILFYDPRGHMIRTVNPDGSEQRMIYGVPGTIASPDLTNPDIFEPTPWEAYTYDSNDNAGRTHPATSKAYQQHWNTPSSIVIDALGRTVMAVQRNRDQQQNAPVIGYETASTYDILGNLLNVTDPLERKAFAYAYDLTNRALRTESIDGGIRTSVFDAANDLVERRDSKGALILHAYDVLNRPIRLWARDAAQTVTLRERLIYGDDSSNSGYSASQAAALNLLGKPYKHYDEAGLLTFGSYDFKGNLLDKTRNAITESALLAPFNPPPPNWVVTPFRVDWSLANLSFLDTATTYQTTTSYDALNRVKSMQYPLDADGSRKLLVPQYNLAGSLESVQMDGSTYVERIAYNAKGQRILISYGNGFMTRYAYDPQTFRILRMRTEKYMLNAATFTYHPSDLRNPLQDFGYEYDLVGNILQIHDRTPGSGIQNTTLGPDALDRNFIYDPIYRLISARGRECKDVPRPRPWSDDPRCGFTKPGVPNQGNAHAMTATYIEDYAYDPAGNMISQVHTTNGSRWTRSFGMGGFTPDQWNQQWPQHLNSPAEWLNPPGNQLTNVGDDSPDTSQTHFYDPNGNLTAETASRHFEWDESDRLRVFRIQLLNAPPSIYTQYLYDSSGQRVMKLIRDQGGKYETTVYFDGLFERQRSVTASATVENNSLHVMDNQKRLAIVRVGTAFPDDAAPAVRYQFGDHLGSSNVVVDDLGSWTNREEYLPYGETSFGSFARKRYRFTGKERDEESGLSYHGARYYAPWLPRWIACDPIVRNIASNLYIYARDNPLNLVDLDGHQENAPAKEEAQPRPISSDRLHNAHVAFLKGLGAAVGENRLQALKDYLTSPLGPLAGWGDTLSSVTNALSIRLPDLDMSLGAYDRTDKGTASWNPLESGLKEFSISNDLTGIGFNLLAQGKDAEAYKAYGDAGYRYGQFTLNMHKLAELAVGGAAVVKAAGSALSGARTYITYVFRDLEGEVRYVGRASGSGDPLKVLWQRIARTKAGEVAREQPWLQPEIIDVQQSSLANKGAEGYYYQQFKEIARQKGLEFFNDPKSPPLGASSAERLTNSLKKLTRFIMGRSTD